MSKAHTYQINVEWTGERAHSITAPGKSEILASADPAFRGDPTRWNPEEMLLASLTSCHMLWYLYLCSVNKITVTAYHDQPMGTLSIDAAGHGRFTEITLKPTITITDHARLADAEKLHHEAHKKCFIANSINFPVKIAATITAQ